VGFPGETEEDFQILLDFLQEAELDRVGVFTYSPVEGAEANALSGHVPEEVKEERKARLMEVQAEISLRKNQSFVGKTLEVLVDELPEPGLAVGRSYRDSPGIDGLVYVETDGTARVGERIPVRITRADTYDLYGVQV
jgi:ribosomal protein S12 methylthiotransferase